jgi:RecB family exonuclease
MENGVSSLSKKLKVSYSQYSMWSQCPHRWKLNYIDRLSTFTDSIHTMFGTSMHEIMQIWVKTIYEVSAKAANELDLNTMLLAKMKKLYAEIMKVEGAEHFTTPEELTEFWKDGCAILDFLKKRRGDYFSKKGWVLKGIETELDYPLTDLIGFRGFVDLILENKITQKIKIIDIKTSTMGWNKWMKTDKKKTDQLLLYKQFYSKQFNTPMDKIDVEYFIVKRKLYENVDWPQKRVQSFIPANGTPSINKVVKNLSDFLNDGFDGGEHKHKDYLKNASKKTCRWCEFNQTEHCDVGVK